MIKNAVKKAYRSLLYPALKEVEKWARTLLFTSLELLFPKFNSFRFFGIPRGIRSISGEKVIDPKVELRKAPMALDPELAHHFSPLQIETPGGHVALLENGFVTASAAALTDKGRLIPEFTEQFGMTDIDRHKLFTFRKNRCFNKIPHFDNTVASLTVDKQSNYFHWLFDALPKIHLMKKEGIIPDRYYAETSKSFQTDSLRMLGISEKQTISSQEHRMISASSLVVTSFPCKQGIPEWACQFLRDTFLPTQQKSSKENNRLFISRNDATWRRVLNEEELYPLLKKEGFKIVETGKFSFVEQIALFQSADLILAPHGAALANLVFCKPGTKLIEIFPPRFTCTCYWTLSNLLGIEYFSFQGVDDKKTYSSECPGYDHMIIDPKRTEKALNLT